MIDNKTKLKILENILLSHDFLKAKKYGELLRYLVNASIKEEDMKESTVAVEFFGKEAAFEPSIDSTVRAYISNLRKKVEHYYLTEGQNDNIQMVLPKGDYHVEFVRTEKNKTAPKLKSNKLPYLIFIPLVIVLVLFIILFQKNRISIKHNKYYSILDNPLWSDFLESEQKTMIVLGDYYTFAMPFDSGRHSYIRDIAINSDEDLEAFLESRPSFHGRIIKTFHTYLEEHIPYCLSFILPLFVIYDKEIELELSSNVQLGDLKNYNIIYIGPYKSLNILKSVTRNLNFNYSLFPNKLDYFHQDSNKIFTYLWLENIETLARNDYAIVVKVSGHNNNTFLLFLSQHDFGNISTVKYFTDPVRIKEFKDQVPSEYFEALFEVKGIARTDFDIRLLHVNPLNAGFDIDLE